MSGPAALLLLAAASRACAPVRARDAASTPHAQRPDSSASVQRQTEQTAALRALLQASAAAPGPGGDVDVDDAAGSPRIWLWAVLAGVLFLVLVLGVSACVRICRKKSPYASTYQQSIYKLSLPPSTPTHSIHEAPDELLGRSLTPCGCPNAPKGVPEAFLNCLLCGAAYASEPVPPEEPEEWAMRTETSIATVTSVGSRKGEGQLRIVQEDAAPEATAAAAAATEARPAAEHASGSGSPAASAGPSVAVQTAQTGHLLPIRTKWDEGHHLVGRTQSEPVIATPTAAEALGEGDEQRGVGDPELELPELASMEVADRRPRLRPCGHSVCGECAREIDAYPWQRLPVNIQAMDVLRLLHSDQEALDAASTEVTKERNSAGGVIRGRLARRVSGPMACPYCFREYDLRNRPYGHSCGHGGCQRCLTSEFRGMCYSVCKHVWLDPTPNHLALKLVQLAKKRNIFFGDVPWRLTPMMHEVRSS